MEINNEEIEKSIELMRKNTLNHIGNDIYLSNNQIALLNMYEIKYKSCNTMKEIIMRIEDILDYEDNEELENLSIELSDFDYYHNTKK